MLKLLNVFAICGMIFACSSRAHTMDDLSGSSLHGTHAFGSIILDFERGDIIDAPFSYGITDCSNNDLYCFFGSPHFQIVLPRECLSLADEIWASSGVRIRIAFRRTGSIGGPHAETYDFLYLVSDGAPNTLFEYREGSGITAVMIAPSGQQWFDSPNDRGNYVIATNQGYYHRKLTLGPTLACEYR